jgi:hypothetical protein
MKAPPAPAITLRTAAVWGTTVLAVDSLEPGRSFKVGGEGAVVEKPDNSFVADFPIRAVGAGWELDVGGATGGEIYLRQRRENPAELGRTGAPIPIVAGDYGLVQYGNFGVFFQFSPVAPALVKRRRFDWALVWSLMFAMVAVGGGLALIWAITTPRGIPKPLELTSQADLMLQFNMKPEDVVPEPQVGKDEDKG